MSNYNTLKDTINANIKQNENQEITGSILNSVLNQMVNILGTGYQFAGVATLDPATDPGTPDAKVFYIANGKGTYTNFGGIEVTEDEVVVLYWDSSWHKVATGIASHAKLSELESEVSQEAKIGSIIGAGDSFVGPVQICELASNTVYRVKIENWDVTGITPDPTSFLFRLMISVDGGTTQTDLIKVTTNNQLEDEYTVVTPANDNILCYLGGRCAAGTKGIVHIECDYDKTVKYNTCVSAYFTGVKSLSVTNIGNSCTVIFPKDTTLHIRRLMGGNMYSHDFGSTEETYTISYDQTLFYDVANDSFSVSIAGTFNINKIALLSYDGRTFSGVLSSFANKEYSYYVAKQNPISVYFTSIKQPSFSFNNSTKTVTVVLPGNCTMRLHSTYVGTVQSIDLREERTFQVAYDQALYINVNTGNLSVAYSNSSEDRSRITLFSYCGTGLNGPLAGFIIGDVVRKVTDSSYISLNGGIIDLNFDVKSKIIQANIASNANYQRSQRDKVLTLLHFSDLHASVREYNRIIEFNNKYGSLFTDVICTGDMVSNKYSDGISWWDKTGAEKFMMIVGNHDTTEGEPNYMTSNHTQEEVYNRYFASRAANWGIEIETNKTYWYKDYDNEKIRIFAYNQFLTGTDDTEQVTWLKTVLQGAITKGYKVVGLVHCTPNNPIAIDCNFTSKAPVLSGFMMNNSALSVIQDFIDGTGDFVGNSGDFICWLCGHIHNDYICKSGDYPNQLFIGVPNAYAGGSDADCNRVVGDKSQDCFNIVAFDTYTEVVKIIRVGADRDYLLRHRGTLTINYKTMSVINQD